jgi:hypothetical protein
MLHSMLPCSHRLSDMVAGFAGRGAKTSWAANPKLAGKGGILATA